MTHEQRIINCLLLILVVVAGIANTVIYWQLRKRVTRWLIKQIEKRGDS